MRRKTAITTAGTVVAVLLAGSIATAANLGILSSTSETEVGELPPTTSPVSSLLPQVETVVVEDPVPQPAPTSDPAVAGDPGGYEDFGSAEQSYEDEDDGDHGDHEDDDHEDEGDHGGDSDDD